jgi:signal transduction histidine kinase
MNDPQDISIDNDEPLPSGLANKFGGWTAKAQNYPIFSPTWFRYRALSFIVPLAFFGVILFAIAFFSKDTRNGQSPDAFAYIDFACTWIAFAMFFFVGRWLATLVYKRHWRPRTEAIGIAIALILGAALAIAVKEGGESIKSTRAQNLEQGVQAQSIPGTPVDATGRETDSSRELIVVADGANHYVMEHGRLFNRIIEGILAVWWGGGLDLLAYFRQRRALKEALAQQELERARVGRNEAEMRLSVLAAQIEPHFLFNTLTGVRSAIISDPARGIAIIDNLVDYLRATIPQMRSDANQSQVLLGPQLDAARAYLGVMHARLPRLTFSVDSDPALLNQPVPPLMLISLVENAVKHGIEPKPGPVHIEVLARKIDDESGTRLELIVTDDGVGFSGVTSGSGIGLANIRERLMQLYGKRAELVLKARVEGGVVASIALPIAA